MKKNILWVLVLLLAWCGKPQQIKIDRLVEDGVEVVINHRKPYKIANEPSELILRKILSIDTEEDGTAATGVTDIYGFDVDSQGNIYILRPPTSPGDLIFQFSNEGGFIRSLGPMGQGPNEMEYPDRILASGDGEIWVTESPKNKYHVFAEDGRSMIEKTVASGFETIIPMKNRNFLVSRLITDDRQAKYFPIVMGLYDSGMNIVRELDRFEKFPNRPLAATFNEKTVNGTGFVFLAEVSGGRIHIGNSDRRYEILVCDLEGRTRRKIRKEYDPVKVSEDYIQNYLKQYEEFMPDYAKKIYFPENWPPFQSFFSDDQGRLFVMTHEPGATPGEFIFDVFNKDGIFTARRALDVICQRQGRIFAVARSDRLYTVSEKDSGFKRLDVFRMIWK